MRRALAATVALILTACSSPQGQSSPAVGAAQARRASDRAGAGENAARGKIQHVVYIIQENRSFNNLFMGYPGAVTQNYGYDTYGSKIPLHEQSLATGWDIDHSFYAFQEAYDNGKLDGWNTLYACCGQPANFAYAYAPRHEVETYWSMAHQYVLADNWFQSHLDGSFIAHQYAIAAYANHEVDFPSTSWGCQGGPADVIPTLNQDRTQGGNVPVCEDYRTLGDELDDAGISWRFYTAALNASGNLWSSYASVNHIYNGPDWTADVINPASKFHQDVANGHLAAVTWITPNVTNSDHAGSNSTTGPAWVGSLVNAVGQSQFWDSTAIFVIWDDWGGWFDPVAPVYEDYDGLGFRVPLLAISPYAKQGYVSHVQYESSSVLKFIEDLFGLPPLAPSDARAADPAGDFFDFSKAPRSFSSFAVAQPRDDAGPRTLPAVGGD